MHYLLILLGLVSGSLWAHDLWIKQGDNGFILYQGHRHSRHAGAEIVPYDPAKVKGFTCIDDSGNAKSLEGSKSYPARVSGDCATLHAAFSTGYWTKTAWETKNLPKTGISGVVKSWYSEESLKLIRRWIAASTEPMQTGLDITPTTNPFDVELGDKLVVLVTYDGKPVSGVPVAYAGVTRGASGRDGKVAIRLRRAGLQQLQASQETALTDGKADSAIRTATLQFELVE